MSCCFDCLVPRMTIDWSDFVANGTSSIPLGVDVDLQAGAGGSLVVAIHAVSIASFDGAAAQIVGKAVVRGCDAEDSRDFVGPELFRTELGQAVSGDAITIALAQELPAIGRVFLDVSQGVNGGASQRLEISGWLRTPEGEHAL